MTRIYAKIIFLTILALVMMAGANGVWGQATWINEDIQSWTARGSYGTYTQTITAGTVNMIECIVQPGASASGTGTIGRVLMQATNGILELPEITSVSTAVFHIAAGGAGRTVKLQKYNGTTWDDVTTFSEIGTTGLIFGYTINQNSPIILRLSSPSAAVYVHDMIISSYPSDTPTLTATPFSLSGFSYYTGSGPSATQFFELTGSNLDGSNVTITAPTNFQISQSESGTYGSNMMLASYDGTAAGIWVRLAAGLSGGEYAGNVEIAGGGATQVDVSVNGSVAPPPPSLPYSENFSGFTSTETLPSGWELDDSYTYQGNFGFGTAGGIRGEGVLGFQLTGNTPNNTFKATLTLSNNTGSDITELIVKYTGRVERVDQAGSPKWVVSVSGTLAEELAYDTSPGVDKGIIYIIRDLSISDGGTFDIDWYTTSTGTSGTRRQIGITGVAVYTDYIFSDMSAPASIPLDATVVLDGIVTLASHLSTGNMIIEPENSLAIASSGSLTLSGTLTNSSGTSGLVIKSGGSLVHNTVGVDATMERDIIGTSGLGEGPAAVDWHLISSPVAAQAISGTWAPTGTGNDYDFFGWKEDETAYPWRNQKVSTNGITEFIPGLGYLAAYQQSGTKAFSGALSSGNVVAQIHFSGAATKDWDSHQFGWNLLGNPYPSAIDWSLAHGNQFEDNYAYVYNRNKSGGPGYDAITGMIAPNQGFFVKTESALTFTFTNAMRVHGGVLLKNMEPSQSLTLRLTRGDYYDETSLLVNDMSGYERDRYDALKLFSFHPDIPQVFSSTSDNIRVAINAIPDVTEETVVPVGIKIPSPGSYEMALTGLAGRFENSDVYLVDRLTCTEILLSEEESYLFDAEATDSDVSRFELRFRSIAGTTDVTNPATEAKARVFASNNTLHVHVDRADVSRMLEVYDVSGRLLMQQPLHDGLQHSMPLNFHCGIYLVRIQCQHMSQTERIFVR